MPTPEEMLIFDKSVTVQNAEGDLDTYHKLRKTEYCLVRDYLLSLLCMDNFQRSGAINGMTLREFRHARVDQGHYVASVSEHKMEEDGPADLVMIPLLHDGVWKYIVSVRPKTGQGPPDDDQQNQILDEAVFLSWSGIRMSSGMVSGRIDSFWKRSLGKAYLDRVGESSRLCATTFRKMGTSAIHKNLPHLKDKAANLMTHSVGVAEREYAIYSKRDTAVETSIAMKKAVRTNFDETPEPIQMTLDIANFSEMPEDRLRVIFGKELVSKEPISKANINSSLEASNINTEMVRRSDLTKLLDRLRYIRRKDTGYIEPDEIVDKEDVCREVVAKPIVGKGIIINKSAAPEEKQKPHTTKRIFYTAMENEIIKKSLKMYIVPDRPIYKGEFAKVVKDIPELDDIVKKVGLRGLIVKVRTERKM